MTDQTATIELMLLLLFFCLLFQTTALVWMWARFVWHVLGRKLDKPFIAKIHPNIPGAPVCLDMRGWLTKQEDSSAQGLLVPNLMKGILACACVQGRPCCLGSAARGQAYGQPQENACLVARLSGLGQRTAERPQIYLSSRGSSQRG
mmetsp:Transcript_37843/g.89854  ORF Transcript_37843/g.89854 Transcript_37843/m.89854 type:complete len:147 (-) Transcript_37843:2100-2540(-)